MTRGTTLMLLAAVLMACSPCGARTMQQKLEAACAADIVALCPAEASEADRLKACLLAHRTRVSAACMALVDASE